VRPTFGPSNHTTNFCNPDVCDYRCLIDVEVDMATLFDRLIDRAITFEKVFVLSLSNSRKRMKGVLLRLATKRFS
jgi:hypothetical protein